ncbi:haloacid dehalogenase-like hydrolase [Salmonella enterica subsp. enterica serovar Morehead]|nr:haloacid dehalogenase-like hydrolase [Salmonella enterica subsp. enterica serovar Newport]EBY2753086.1 haloacid dehalogenase-like hydrolase [Salmonella enterica subsp. enterica serovar Kottbus]EEM2539367.1 haloacid dehalogenase-like hydrolase [Salmonella enterica subsp. enterica serovar Morehead]EHN5888771.1 haloacid dehalogenase-like hydrolase [Salmonella enterica subsp. enterica serovar Newport]
MNKRLLNCFASDFLHMSPPELKASIKASEGRTILSENVAPRFPVGHDITNSEVARAFGADLILLNALDLFKPEIGGLEPCSNPVQRLKHLVGRPVGVNLEPVDDDAMMTEDRLEISQGRQATRETFEKANELSFDFICLTGNPGTGVTNNKIIQSVKTAKSFYKGLIIAGKMHGAGVDEEVINIPVIESLIHAGADIILLPAVGTVPGITTDMLSEVVKIIRKSGALSMSAIGTSQESADVSTIREIALMNKIAGVDIQHIGDAGYAGLAPYMNILEMSRTIRGDRHTIHMISASVNR